ASLSSSQSLPSAFNSLDSTDSLDSLDCLRLRRLRFGAGLHQTTHGLGRLRAALDPVLRARGIKTNLAVFTNRVVSADAFEIRAIALRELLFDYDPVRRSLL